MSHPDHDRQLDATFQNTRREAGIIFALWVVALLWCVPYCYIAGYGPDAATHTVWGIPSWAFWGIAAPWTVASIFALWFSLRVMTDDDLGEGADADADAGTEVAR